MVRFELRRAETVWSLAITYQHGLARPKLDEAAAAIAEIRGDYDRHARAAREIAREFFDAEMLMRRMLGACGL